MEWVLVFDNVEKASTTFAINESKLVRIGENKICLSRLHDGFFAFDDTCPHQGASLSMGDCKPNGTVQCPWHHFLFDVRNGKNVGNTATDIKTYEVKIEHNQLFIAV